VSGRDRERLEQTRASTGFIRRVDKVESSLKMGGPSSLRMRTPGENHLVVSLLILQRTGGPTVGHHGFVVRID